MSEKSILDYLSDELEKYPAIPFDEFNKRIISERKNYNLEERKKLLIPHLRLVKIIAVREFRKYKPNSLEIEDLITDGYLGLEKAYEKFDANNGTKFSTYAGNMIKHRITRTIDNQGNTIRIPVTLSTILKDINIQKSYHKKTFGMDIETSKLEKITNYKLKKIMKALEIEYLKHPSSLERTIYDDKKTILKDNIPSKNDFEDNPLDNFNQILELSDKLTEKEIYVLKQRYIENETFREIGDEINLTKQRIEQIHKKAIEKLREEKNKIKEMYGF